MSGKSQRKARPDAVAAHSGTRLPQSEPIPLDSTSVRHPSVLTRTPSAQVPSQSRLAALVSSAVLQVVRELDSTSSQTRRALSVSRSALDSHMNIPKICRQRSHVEQNVSENAFRVRVLHYVQEQHAEVVIQKPSRLLSCSRQEIRSIPVFTWL